VSKIDISAEFSIMASKLNALEDIISDVCAHEREKAGHVALIRSALTMMAVEAEHYARLLEQLPLIPVEDDK